MLQPTFIAEINGKTHVKFNRQLFELNPEAFTVTTLKGREMQFSHYNKDGTKLIFKYTEGGLETLIVFNSDGEFIRGYQSQNEYLYLRAKDFVVENKGDIVCIIYPRKGEREIEEVYKRGKVGSNLASYTDPWDPTRVVIPYETGRGRKLKAKVAEWQQKYKLLEEQIEHISRQYDKVCKALVLSSGIASDNYEGLAGLVISMYEADK